MFSEVQSNYECNDPAPSSGLARAACAPGKRERDRQDQPLVLIVDDDENTREAVQTLLELDGYQVAAAGDGQEALDLLDDGLRPRLILLDLNMPRMDGATFRQAQRRRPALANIPVIVCSGSVEYEHKRVGLDAVAYLQKPMVVNHLMDVVHRQCPH